MAENLDPNDPEVQSAARGWGRDRMDDALQEAYVNALRALASFRGEAELGTWLYLQGFDYRSAAELGR